MPLFRPELARLPKNMMLLLRPELVRLVTVYASTVPRGVFVQYARKSRGLQRQNALKTHFVCIAKRVAVSGQHGREQ